MSDNEAFVESIHEATQQLISEMTGKVEKACILVERDAKANCPVDLGILRASITHEVSVTPLCITGCIGSNLEYAPYVHNGTGVYAMDGNGRKTPWVFKVRSGKYKGFHVTVGQKPQPFLQNAVINNRQRIERMLAQ